MDNSIIAYADFSKKSSSGFQYMIEAQEVVGEAFGLINAIVLLTQYSNRYYFKYKI
jgi:hypothetical protein